MMLVHILIFVGGMVVGVVLGVAIMAGLNVAKMVDIQSEQLIRYFKDRCRK